MFRVTSVEVWLSQKLYQNCVLRTALRVNKFNNCQAITLAKTLVKTLFKTLASEIL